MKSHVVEKRDSGYKEEVKRGTITIIKQLKVEDRFRLRGMFRMDVTEFEAILKNIVDLL